jgi:hypothetical protein
VFFFVRVLLFVVFSLSLRLLRFRFFRLSPLWSSRLFRRAGFAFARTVVTTPNA